MIEKLNDYQSSVVINDAQIRITAHMKAIADLEPQVKEYYEAYIKLQRELDATKEKMEHDQELLEWASRMKNGIHSSKELRVLRSESHNDMKEREKRKLQEGGRKKHKNWTDTAVQKLRAIDKFVLADDLWDILAAHYEVPKDREFRKIRWAVINNCLLANDKLTRLGRLRGVLIEHKGYIGLKEWVTDDFKPKGKYSSQFTIQDAV